MVKVLRSENGVEGLSERACYKYDYRGLCVYKSSERGVEYREYTADGRLIYVEKDGSKVDYVYNGSTIFAEVRAEGGKEEVYYHHTNHLGTTEVISDSEGVVVWEANYEAFGSVLSENGTKAFAASFTGKLYDEDIGLYYFNARWYDSESGRFVTQDPARDGSNWYGYCGQNPITFQDPTGLTTIVNENDNHVVDVQIDGDTSVLAYPYTSDGQRCEGPAQYYGQTMYVDSFISPVQKNLSVLFILMNR